MAWLPEPAPLKGPERATAADIDALNRVFSEAFTDRYRRDGLNGMRVPHLNPLVWRYAMRDPERRTIGDAFGRGSSAVVEAEPS